MFFYVMNWLIFMFKDIIDLYECLNMFIVRFKGKYI